MPDHPSLPPLNNVIRNGQLEADIWRAFVPDKNAPASASATHALPPDENGWLVTLATWRAARDALRLRRHPVAVYLGPDADPEDLLEAGGATIDATGIAHLAIDFPVYTDGRGYSLAQLLRTQYGWGGELRAVGDVMIDTVHYMARCGFDAFAVKPSHDPQAALAALGTFTVHYQKTYPAAAAPAMSATSRPAMR
ncbi:DUF934 domain-containing protein [Cupriavidus basilensis]|uniref:Oxidoreductase probably involved in sulfite reduction n=1 Tax=Cupriavidus basilensis TaxID=68895 RepID=A0A0C4YNP6_9BURK|nr:DUF934 domain-containing protein [Cupriavidus basilensis]AJG24125.1 Oxidoreductase probably involved in sulfite reduction [Cupriavidus basilensis]